MLNMDYRDSILFAVPLLGLFILGENERKATSHMGWFFINSNAGHFSSDGTFMSRNSPPCFIKTVLWNVNTTVARTLYSCTDCPVDKVIDENQFYMI